MSLKDEVKHIGKNQKINWSNPFYFKYESVANSVSDLKRLQDCINLGFSKKDIDYFFLKYGIEKCDSTITCIDKIFGDFENDKSRIRKKFR